MADTEHSKSTWPTFKCLSAWPQIMAVLGMRPSGWCRSRENCFQHDCWCSSERPCAVVNDQGKNVPLLAALQCSKDKPRRGDGLHHSIIIVVSLLPAPNPYILQYQDLFYLKHFKIFFFLSLPSILVNQTSKKGLKVKINVAE